MTLSNDEVAKRFADGKKKGTAKNMYIEGDKIYSYGHHFPIAVRCANEEVDYLFNPVIYSQSTSRHQHAVRQHISGTVLEVKGCNLLYATEQFVNNLKEMVYLRGKAERAYKDVHRERYLDRISYLKAQNKLLKRFMAEETIIRATNAVYSE